MIIWCSNYKRILESGVWDGPYIIPHIFFSDPPKRMEPPSYPITNFFTKAQGSLPRPNLFFTSSEPFSLQRCRFFYQRRCTCFTKVDGFQHLELGSKPCEKVLSFNYVDH